VLVGRAHHFASLQTDPCGVEAPDRTSAKRRRVGLQTDPCGVEASWAAPCRSLCRPVTDGPLWG